MRKFTLDLFRRVCSLVLSVCMVVTSVAFGVTPQAAADPLGWTDSTDARIHYHGGWNDYAAPYYFGGSFRYVNAPGTATLRFKGTSVSMFGTKASSYGILQVSVDGGAPVDVDLYSSGWAVQQQLWTTAGLSDATHTVDVSWTGRKNAASSGTETNLDAVDVGTGKLVAAATPIEFETTTSTVGFNGLWKDFDNASFSGGRQRTLSTVGDARIAFKGSGIELYGTRASALGIARVRIDGGAWSDVDFYASSWSSQQQLYLSPRVVEGDHLLEIEWTGRRNPASTGSGIEIDRLDVCGELLPTNPSVPVIRRYEAELATALVNYDGAWNNAYATACSSGYHQYQCSIGSARITFRGTALALISTKAPDGGIMNVSIDGGPATLVDLYSTSYAYQQTVWSATALSDTTHTVVAEWTGLPTVNSQVNIDAIDVRGDLIPGTTSSTIVTRYDTVDARMRFSPEWQDFPYELYVGGSFRHVDTPATARIRFAGTQIALIGTRASSYGIARVSIDGGAYSDVDMYSGAWAAKQTLWSRTGMVDGEHVMTVEWTGRRNPASTGTEVNLDAIDIRGTLLAWATRINSGDYVAGHWTESDAPYLLSGAAMVTSGTSLTIDPGVVVKGGGGGGLTVNGTLFAVGTATKPIVFTSIKDDTVGGDTDNSTATPAPGDMVGPTFSTGSSASRLEHAVLRYAYTGVKVSDASPTLASLSVEKSSNRGIDVYCGSPSIDGCTVSDSGADGIWVQGGSPNITGTTVIRSGRYGVAAYSPVSVHSSTVSSNTLGAMYLSGSISPDLLGVTGDGNGLDAINLNVTASSPSVTLPAVDAFPYTGTLTVPSGSAMAVAPGTVFKNISTTVNGTLSAVGTATKPIVFTSIKDDTVGGDTDNSTATPAPGDMVGPTFSTGSSASRLEHAVLRYAYTGVKVSDASPTLASLSVEKSSNRGIDVYCGSPSIDGCTVSDSGADGIWVQGGSPNITGTTVIRSARRGLTAYGMTGCQIRQSKMVSNAMDGMYLSASTPYIVKTTIQSNGGWGAIATKVGNSELIFRYSDIIGNAAGRILSSDPTNTVDARYNYWGTTNPSDMTAGFNGIVYTEPWGRAPYATTRPQDQVLGGYTPCGRYGEPVNTATGNFYFEALDLPLPGIGPSVAIPRTYNSQDASRATSLGYGWSSSLDTGLQFDENGAVALVAEDGARRTFESSGTGYTIPSGTTDTLSRLGNGSFELRSLDGFKRTFDATGSLIADSDKWGNAVSYSRDSLSRISRVEGTGGRWIVLSYAAGHLVQASDSASRTVSYTYSGAGDLTEVAGPGAKRTLFAYDSVHRIISAASAEHPLQPFVVNEYSSDGRVVRQKDGFNTPMTFTYNGLVTSIVNNEGHTVVHEHDQRFRLLRETDGTGNSLNHSYNSAGLKSQTQDALGRRADYSYDGNGNVTAVTDGLGHAAKASYDASNNLLWSEDALGHRTTYSYDASGNVSGIDSPSGHAFFDHYANGLMRHSVLAGNTTTYQYDSAGRLTSLVDPLGFESRLEYSTAGFLAAAVDAEGRRTESTYDEGGRLTSTKDAMGGVASFSYDSNGNRTSVTDPTGNRTVFRYDVMDQLSSVIDPVGKTTDYSYDRNYNLASVTDPLGHRTEYAYSANDLLTRVQDPGGRLWKFDYDAAGGLTKTTYPDGHFVAQEYDACGLLHSMDSTNHVGYSFGYDPNHSLVSVASSDGASWMFRRDGAGRVVTATDTVDASHPLVIDRAYNGSGLVASLTVGARAPRSSFYDADGRLTRIEQPDGTIKGIDLAYDRSGLPTRIGALTPESFAYDAAGRVTSMSAGPLARTYSRNAAGRIVSENGERFGYDAAGRLTSWYDRATDTTTAYEYDATSNLTRQSAGATLTLDLTFDASNRITSGGYAYDAGGNLTRRPGQRLVYDALNRLTAVVNDSTEATIVAYTYDPSNRRTSSTTASGTVYFHYDGSSGDVIAETDAAGKVTCQYVRDGSGRLVAVERFDDTSESCFTNQRGDVVGHWTNSGTPSETVRFDPWGNVVSGGVSTSVPYGFAGSRYDRETGLYYMWNRYYDPVTHRFLTKDLYPGETTNPATMNPYLYCLGDPVNAVDPSGLHPWYEWASWTAGGILGSAVWLAVAVEAPVWAGIFLVAGTALTFTPPAASTWAYNKYLAPTLRDDYASVMLWKKRSEEAAAQGRCDVADKLDGIWEPMAKELDDERRGAYLGIITDAGVSAVTYIASLSRGFGVLK